MKDIEAQRALGLVKKYRVDSVVFVPYNTMIAIPFEMNVEATSEKDAKEKAMKQFTAMKLEQRKKFIWDNIDDDSFRDCNYSDRNTFMDSIEKYARKSKAKDYKDFEVDYVAEAIEDERET